MAKKEAAKAKKRPKKTHPSGDERYTVLDRAMKRFKYEKDALLEVLHSAQETFGFLSEDLLVYVSTNLRVPLSQVYGVATFYHLFTFEPLGKHNCIVCTGTACHVKGSSDIVRAVSQRFDVADGSTTDDGLLSLSSARCLGSCGIAPVVVMDGEVVGKVMPDGMVKIVEEILAKETEAQPTVETG